MDKKHSNRSLDRWMVLYFKTILAESVLMNVLWLLWEHYSCVINVFQTQKVNMKASSNISRVVFISAHIITTKGDYKDLNGQHILHDCFSLLRLN